MGWKNLKDHYRIGHIVQVREGRIGIGSGYIHDLIRVTFDGKVTWGNLGPSKNDDLARYYAEMTADLGKVKALLDAPDTFATSLTVWTYQDAEILEKHCEAYGWPNVTHDGLIQYDNTFSPDRDKVIAWAKRSKSYDIKSHKRNLKELEEKIAKRRQWLAETEDHLAKLEADYPHISYQKPEED